MAFTLTLLGTDTQFSPNYVINAFDKCETLSYISTLINKKITMPVDDVIRFRNEDVAVIDGPTTWGLEIGDRIVRGVTAILEAVSRGEINISVIAHSRGAVQAILVAHELERIQKLLLENSTKFTPEILNSVCKHTKDVMSGFHKSAIESLNWDEISKHINNVKLSMFNIDPVPGGSYIGATYVSTLPWRDSRFYELPKIVKEYEQFIYENERTRCFKPIVPKCVSQETKFKLQSLPGHHGTGSGNLLDQQRRVNSSTKSTEHVQELVVVRLVDFLTCNGVKITPKIPESDPFTHLISALFNDPTKNEKILFKNLYFNLYNKIVENREAYCHYNTTSYAVLGQEQAISRLIWNVTDQRIVHYKAHNDTFLETIIPPVPGNHFLNYEHARMHLNNELGITDDVSLSETIKTAVARLVRICKHTTRLQEINKTGHLEKLTDSIIEDQFASVLAKKENFDILLDTLSTLIEKVRQFYLQNKLQDTDELKAIYKEVHNTFTEFANLTQEDPKNELAQKIFDKLKSDLKFTLTMKLKCLKEQYQSVLKEKQFFTEFENKIRTIIERLEEKKLNDNFTEVALLEQLNGLLIKAQTFQEENLLFYQELEHELKVLRELEVYSELAVESREWACLVLGEAIDKNLSHVIQEVILSFNELSNFKKVLPNFIEFDNTFDCAQWENELEGNQAQIIHLTAQYIFNHKISLEIVKAAFGSEHVALYNQIEGLAIGMGMVNPLSLTIEKLTAEKNEQEQLIQELISTNQKQNATINDKEVNFQIIINKLTPLTKNYLIHLAQEIKRLVAPALDVSDFSNLDMNVNIIDKWSEDSSIQILKQKFNEVSELHNILNSRSNPSEKVSHFYKKLNDIEQIIQTHRNPAWMRYTMLALSILVTGIVPGLIILAYSVLSDKTPKFCKSSGQVFFQSVKKEIENEKHPALKEPFSKSFMN
ncbi:hypothetical protein [Legionella sp.]|uniref:hypothetical protein n=1 Tax=Legionella sp. TaxID=459 RepID=UPI003C9C78D9